MSKKQNNGDDWDQQGDGGLSRAERESEMSYPDSGCIFFAYFLALPIGICASIYLIIKFSYNVRWFQGQHWSILPICILLGVVISYFSRNAAKKRKKWKSSISILIKDYTFDDFVFINLLSLFYAIGQGGLIGASIGYILIFLVSILQKQQNFFLLLISIACLFAVLVLRVLIETIIVIFKRNSASSKWFTLHTALTLKSHPELGDGLDPDEEIKGGGPNKID